jgi:hypothetical protein
MVFDRNNFEQYARWNATTEKANCSVNHSAIVKHVSGASFNSSFRSISDTDLENYTLVGSLRDPRIKTLDYIACDTKEGNFWNPASPIATNFYPYHICNVYRCNTCGKLFLVYTEHAGHGPDLRIRAVKPELILEEPANLTLEITADNIPSLLEILEMSAEKFETVLNSNDTLQFVNSIFENNDIIVKRKGNNNYLIVGSRRLVRRLIDRFG